MLCSHSCHLKIPRHTKLIHDFPDALGISHNFGPACLGLGSRFSYMKEEEGQTQVQA